MMETFRKRLLAECTYQMKDETMDMFLESMTELKLKAFESLIPYGALDSNVYVVKDGIIRAAYFNGDREMTFAFGAEGTMVNSYHSFYNHELSFFKFEACCDSVIMKVSKAKFLELIQQSHDFSQWVTWMSISQLWLYEKKLAVVNGNAREKLDAFVKNRPEIMEKVPMKYIASYIGITPQYLSNLKQEIKLESKKNR